MRGHDFNANSLEELAEKCREHSIKHIQLVLKKSIAGLEEGNFTEEYAKKLGEILKNAGIEVDILGCYINPSETDEVQLQKNIDWFTENLYYAKYLNAGAVALETGFVGDKIDVEKNNTEEAYRHLLKNMTKLCRKAEELGVKIAIEGVYCFVINTPKKMKRLLEDLNSDNVFVIFDPVNYLNYENYTDQTRIFEEYEELLIDKTGVIHLKDFKPGNNELCYEYPFDGFLDKKTILRIIKKCNPNTTIILEEVREEKLDEVRNGIYKMTNIKPN